MKRGMLFFERLMYIDGVTPLNCLMTARLRGTIDPNALRTALSKLQAKHPLLRARVVEEAGKPNFVFDDEVRPIPVRVVERQGDDDWREITVAEWKTPFATEQGPLMRVIWIRSEAVSEVMLVAHHCVCDGGSMMTLIREVLIVADHPETVLEPYTSYASLEDLIPAEILNDKKTLQGVRRKALLYKLFLAAVASRSTPFNVGEPYVLYWAAEAARFAAINDRCQAEGTSAYAALCVAYLQAFRKVQGRRAKNKIMCPVSIRRFIRAVRSDMMFAFAPTIPLSLPKEAEADFWVLARGMKQSIGEKVDGLDVYGELMLGAFMKASVHRVLNFLFSSRGGHDLAFSNVGRLKFATKYEHYQLEAVLGSTVMVPWRNTNTLIMTHFMNRMELGFLSNERFLPRVEAERIQREAIGILEDAIARPRSVEGSGFRTADADSVREGGSG
jgi:NRPS condensation-like uncharacterized protein